MFKYFNDTEHFQLPDEILPILLQFLQQLSLELRSGNKMKHVNRMVYALETFSFIKDLFS